jgi:hypothetical protein
MAGAHAGIESVEICVAIELREHVRLGRDVCGYVLFKFVVHDSEQCMVSAVALTHSSGKDPWAVSPQRSM